MNTQIENSTLEELENNYWPNQSEFPTKLVHDIFLLRKKKIADLDSNNLRLLISQNVGLEFIIPIVINRIEKNALEEALFYPGDLLLALLASDEKYWLNNEGNKKRILFLLKNINLVDYDLDDDIRKDIISSANEFISKYNE